MKIMTSLKNVGLFIVFMAIALGIACGLSFWGIMEANANVAVRPELATVDWWTAVLAGHGFDWLWYHFPVVMTIVVIVIAEIVAVVFGIFLLSED